MSGPNTAFIAQWRQTPSLRALRELIQVAEQVAPAVARRADLSHSELRALEMLIASPHGPVELAKGLGVTSAASSGMVEWLCVREGGLSERPAVEPAGGSNAVSDRGYAARWRP